MQIFKINFKNNIPLIPFKQSFKSNPIEKDSFTRSVSFGKKTENNSAGSLSEEDIEKIKKMQEENAEIQLQMVSLTKMKSKIKLTSQDSEALWSYSCNDTIEQEISKEKIKKILSGAIENENADEKTLDILSDIVRRTFREKARLESHNLDAIKDIAKWLPVEIDNEILRLNRRKGLNESRIKRTIKISSETKKFDSDMKSGLVIDLSGDEYSNISERAKICLGANLDPKHKYQKCLLRTQCNEEFMAELANCRVYTTEEISRMCSPAELELISPNAKQFFNNGYNDDSKTIFAIPFDDSIAIKILDDIEKSEVIAFSKRPWEIQKIKDAEHLPLKYRKYSDSDELQPIDFTFIDLNDENNSKILGSAYYSRQIMNIPFIYNELGYVDMSDPYNKRIMDNTHGYYPKKSPYFYSSAGCDDKSSPRRDIPVEYLEKLGFSQASTLVELIKKGKLDGIINSDGKAYVTIDITKALSENKNLSILEQLREKNPRTMTFHEVVKRLRIKPERLNYAIFIGDFEIIDECLNITDKRERYINIATPKNQEFIKKIKFEQELQKRLEESKREQNEKIRIERQDINARLAGLRMTLVWGFMPDTRKIATQLAKKDGYLCKLLAKEDDPDENLTPHEEAKINSYRKEMWLKAGTDELKQAYKKANEIIKIYKEKGITAIPEEYLPLFEKYGFSE